MRIKDLDTCNDNQYLVPIGISNRHVHLSQKDLEVLFGAGYQLTNIKDLTQPGQYACEECVDLIGSKGVLENVRILGPVRPQSQVELAKTDARKLGVEAPLRESGDLKGSAPITLVGPQGRLELKEGAIVAYPHLHLSLAEGAALGIADREMLDVYFKGHGKYLCMQEVLARVNAGGKMDLHIDTDEANAAGINNGEKALVVKVALP